MPTLQRKFITTVDPMTGELRIQANTDKIIDLIPSVSDWARAPQKPTYTATEIESVSFTPQILSEEQKEQVRNNIGVSVPLWALQDQKPSYTAAEVGAISYAEAQELTEPQKAQARTNMSATKEWPIIFDGDTALTVADQTEYYFNDELELLSITFPEDWNRGKKAYIRFKSGTEATALQLPANSAYVGTVSAETNIEISIYGYSVVIVSI